MNKILNKITNINIEKLVLILSIILIPTFLYSIKDMKSIVYIPKLSLIILLSCLLFSIELFRVSKFMGLLFGLTAISAFKTLLLGIVDRTFLYEHLLTTTPMFILYYYVRKTKIKEDLLTWLLVPAWINISFIFIQRFTPYFTDVCGLLGNSSFSACYLAMMAPVFVKYNKWGFSFLIASIILCNSSMGFLVLFGLIIFYLYNLSKKWCCVFTSLTAASIFIISSFGILDKYRTEVLFRIGTMVKAFDGIIYHFWVGWGQGSFIPVFARIPKENFMFNTVRLNTPTHIANHAHNELLMGWWNYGILFPILVILYFIFIVRKYNKTNILPAAILFAGFLISMTSLMTFTLTFLVFLSLGIYENQGGENGEKSNTKRDQETSKRKEKRKSSYKRRVSFT